MKKSYTKYILCLLFGIFFFGNGIAFGACSNDMSAGFRDDLPGDGQQNGQCWSNATQGDDWYNNQNPLSDGANLFLKMINKTWVECDSQNVALIQTEMQNIGGMCSTCIDGRAGNHMRNVIGNCVSIMCPTSENKKSPDIGSNGNLFCSDDDYYLDMDDNCCIKLNGNDEYIPFPPIIDINIRDYSAFVTIDFSDNDIDKFSNWGENSLILIEGGNIQSEISKDNNLLKVDFLVGNLGPSLKITVKTGLAIFSGNIKSPMGYQISDTDSGNCSNPPIQGDCNTYGSNFIYEYGCCIESDSCLNPPDDSGNCDQYGGIWYLSDGGCCVMGDACVGPDESGNCMFEGYVVDGYGCCSLASAMCTGNLYLPVGSNECKRCLEGEMPNENHTKCICDPSVTCCGIKLNTVVPFIGDCIEIGEGSSGNNTISVNEITAFPILMQGLMKIIMSAILVFSFIMIVLAGFLMTSGVFKQSLYTKGTDIIKKVIISLILLGCSGLILSLINPSFFGG